MISVGFIGIGHMGWPMGARLIGAGFDLAVADSSAARAAEFAKAYGARALSVPSVLAESDIVITMLPTSSIVEGVLCSSDVSWKPGALVVEMSSGAPSHTRTIATALSAHGVRLIDAPVSGGVKRAEIGDLAIMCGGSDADLDRAQPLLAAMGSSIVRTGAVGSAHAMKALNNLVSAAGFAAGVEALVIGKRFGLDPAVMVDVLNASSGMNNSTRGKFKQFVLSGTFNSGFGLDLMVKDIRTALDLANETQTEVPLSGTCLDIWAASATALGPGRDHTEMSKWSEMIGEGKLRFVADPVHRTRKRSGNAG